MTGFVPYHDGLEVIRPDEDRTSAQLAEVMGAYSRAFHARYQHAVRSVHSKSHGVAVGELTVAADVPAAYAQGLFGRPGRYPALLRVSTPPGDILPDSVSTPRAVALKVVGPPGEVMVDGHAGEVTQDFLLNNGPVFGAGDAAGFLRQQRPIRAALNAPEEVKVVAALGAQAAQRLTRGRSRLAPLLRQVGGHPYTHPLGETFYSQLPLRWGGHVAKVALFPVSGHLRALTGRPVRVLGPGRADALRAAVARALRDAGGEWELRAQLCVDTARMPVEDGAVRWDEALSPFVTVARLRVPPQDAARPDKLAFGDRAAFSPWHALAAHRPLGNAMRARRRVYELSAAFRREHNDEPAREPRAAADLPTP